VLVACFSIFNEVWNIERSLDSVRDCDRIVVLDGAFSGFPHKLDTGQSDDGTLDVVSRWLQKWTLDRNDRDGWLVVPEIPWINQMMKRSFYFRFGEPGDWFLVIDGDEVVESGLSETKHLLESLEGPAFWVEKEYVQKQVDPAFTVERRGLSPRLFLFHEGLRYGITYDDFPHYVRRSVPLQMRHLRFPPIRDNERREIKSRKQTSADFACVTMIKNPYRRVSGTQIRLIRFQNGLRYGSNHSQIVDLTGNLFDGESPLNVPLTLEIIPRSDDRDVLMSQYDEFRTKHHIESS